MSDVPAGYRALRVGDREIVAHESVAADLAQLLEPPATLYEWAAGLPQPRAMRGRAPVYIATLPSSQVTVVVRHVWHGGLLAPLTGDRFRTPTRAPVELRTSLELRAAGIDTSEILAYVLYPAGTGLRRVDVVSQLIPDAHDLGAVISDFAPDMSVADALPAVRTLLERLAAAHAVHPDLNVKNILLSRTARGSLRAAVIDVDVVRFVPTLPAQEVMRTNTARLARSLRKWRTRFGASMSDAAADQFITSCTAAVPGPHPDSRIA